MKAAELKKHIEEGGLSAYAHLYSDTCHQKERFIGAIDAFDALYGSERDVSVMSVPGRSEISGNHTDHNHGCVLAGAINRDIIAVVSKRDDGIIRLKSEGYDEITVDVREVSDPSDFADGTSRALVGGVVNGFLDRGLAIGGFDAYTTTEVLKGSGLSSSAAFEVMIGNILNHLYNGGAVDNKEIAKISQYAENVYFGKPCGLMDQMACAVGGFVYIDFEDPKSPIVEPIDLSLSDMGYSLCIVNTGGNHANLTPDYAAVPAEMRAVAKALGKEVLRGISECDIISEIPTLRADVGDRAILRAIHFVRENERVAEAKAALKCADVDAFFDVLLRSGRSSFQYLQNVYTTVNVAEQGLSLALALAEGYLKNIKCAYRVHGGGFAGTIQVFLPTAELDGFCRYMDASIGEGASMPLGIRSQGAVKLF